jgi:hypothetical protein
MTAEEFNKWAESNGIETRCSPNDEAIDVLFRVVIELVERIDQLN